VKFSTDMAENLKYVTRDYLVDCELTQNE